MKVLSTRKRNSSHVDVVWKVRNWILEIMWNFDAVQLVVEGVELSTQISCPALLLMSPSLL